MAWFLCPYKRRLGPRIMRYCAMDDFTAQIRADGGTWREIEVLGNHAIVKVKGASGTTLAAISVAPGFTRLPKDLLTSPLSDLTNAQKLAIRNKIEELGYARAEWQARLGTDLGAVTLADVLRFIATRRRKPRYDAATDTVVLDGPEMACGNIENLESTAVTVPPVH